MWVSKRNTRSGVSGSYVFLAATLIIPGVMLLMDKAPSAPADISPEHIFCDAETVRGDTFVMDGRKFFGGQYQSRDRAFSGNYSCKLGKDRIYGIRYDLTDPDPEAQYKASVWASRTGGDRPNLVAADLGGFYAVESIPVIRRDDGWELLELYFKVPDDYKEFIKVYVYANEGSGAIYYDDLRIERIGTVAEPDTAELAEVQMTMSQQAYDKLARKKWDAVANGILISTDEDWVNARLRTRGQPEVDVEVRLKGDWLDHLKGDKWSMRIKVQNQQTWRRLRTFSVHSPETRFHLREWLYHQLLEEADVLTPRYDFLELTLNNKTLGVYAYEEHFEKQLVESKGRREGPVLKMAEEGFWLNYKRQEDIYGAGTIPQRMTDAFWQSDIQPFKPNRLAQNPAMLEAFERARDLLYGYKYGLLAFEDVFDTELMARYYAVTDLQQAYHGIAWHNQRFYYNTITGKLEPIGFDGFGDLTAPTLGADRPFLGYHAHVNSTEDMFDRFFGEPAFTRAYHKALLDVTSPAWYEPVYLNLDPRIEVREALLAKEFSDAALDLDVLSARARMIRYHLFPLGDVSLLARSKNVDLSRQQVTVTNHFPLPLDVIGYTGPDKSNLHSMESPLFVPNGKRFAVPPSRDIDLPTYARYVAFQLAGVDSVYFTEIKSWSAPEFRSSEIDISTTETVLLDFLRIVGHEAVIRSGDHTISNHLILPKGVSLIIEPGTTLDIISGASVVVQGPVQAIGFEDAPIVIRSSDQSAAGFTVLNANRESTLQHVRFEGLNTYRQKGHVLTGAVTFYQSDLILRNCAFVDNQCEDALNTFRCHIDIDGLFIANTLFDGFDSDFCEGRIKRAVFRNVANDALDFSGSAVIVEDCTIDGAGDKGISVGEESRIKVLQALIENCNIAVASKDLSTLEIVDITMRDCKQGFTAYQKKPEFGPAELTVHKYEATGVKQLYLIESGSRLTLAGRENPGI